MSGFANQDGGLLLIPATTRPVPNGEVIEEVGDLSLSLVDAKQIRDVVYAWVYPAVEGLEVDVIETSPGRGRLLIHVPPQRPESWPHFVTHALIGDRLRGASVAIFVRYDTDTRSLHAAKLHALLTAGRRAQLLEGARSTANQTEPDPPVLEPMSNPSPGSFNFVRPGGPFNAHLQNVGGVAALVDTAQLHTPTDTFDGLMWVQEGRSSSVPPEGTARVPRGGHLIVRFESPRLSALLQSSGALKLSVVFRPPQGSGRWQYDLELLRTGSGPGDRPVWRGGAEQTHKLPEADG